MVSGDRKWLRTARWLYRCFRVTATRTSARCAASILQWSPRLSDSCRIVLDRKLSAWEWSCTAVRGKVCRLHYFEPSIFVESAQTARPSIWVLCTDVQQSQLLQARSWIYSIPKTRSLWLIWHNFTNSQRLLFIHGTDRPYAILNSYDKKFLNLLRTSCVVSVTTAVTSHTRTAKFWADFEQRIIDRAINEWQNDCEPVSV